MSFKGKVLFLDRSDINTDEIIPAKYLTEIDKNALAPHCLEDLKLPSFDPSKDLKGVGAIISKANFGCGSSREHAPWALETNGIKIVVAINFARIFKGNMFNGGLLAISLTESQINEIFELFSNLDTQIDVDLDKSSLTLAASKLTKVYSFSLGEFEKDLVHSGGWVGYANSHY